MRLPDEVRVHEFSAYRTQGVITPVFYQGQLASIEDHAHLGRERKEAWRKMVEGMLWVRAASLTSACLVPALCLQPPHPLPLTPLTRSWNGLMKWCRGIELYSHSHFQRSISHCHQTPARLSAERRKRQRQCGQRPRTRLEGCQWGGRDGVPGGFDITQKMRSSDSCPGPHNSERWRQNTV